MGRLMCVDDDLTTARAKVAEIKARIKATDDEADREYLRLVIVQWDRLIARLEAKDATRQAAIQADC